MNHHAEIPIAIEPPNRREARRRAWRAWRRLARHVGICQAIAHWHGARMMLRTLKLPATDLADLLEVAAAVTGDRVKRDSLAVVRMIVRRAMFLSRLHGAWSAFGRVEF